MFMIAFQMALPVVGSLFLVDVALGIVARTVPQLNIFVVGFPVKIAVSFIMLIRCYWEHDSSSFRNYLKRCLSTMRGLMTYLGGLKMKRNQIRLTIFCW